MASSMGLELHHPTVSILWGNKGRSKRKVSILITNHKVVSGCKAYQQFGMPRPLKKPKSGSGCKSHRYFDTYHFIKQRIGREKGDRVSRDSTVGGNLWVKKYRVYNRQVWITQIWIYGVMTDRQIRAPIHNISLQTFTQENFAFLASCLPPWESNHTPIWLPTSHLYYKARCMIRFNIFLS